MKLQKIKNDKAFTLIENRCTKFLSKIKQNSEFGFTLIEMMIVLLVISVLLIITIPNVTKHNSKINSKGCEAFIQMVQAQVQAYEIDKKEPPTAIQQLVDAGYLTDKTTSCPNGDEIKITSGKVELADSAGAVPVADSSGS